MLFRSFVRAIAIGIALNLGFVAIEAGYGFVADSVALLADAGHNLSDVLWLALAWGGATLAKAPPSKRFTHGLRGSSILAALGNAVLLLVALGAIVLEAVQRIGDPPHVAGLTVSIVAGDVGRSEEHTSELQSLMRISYAVFCLKKKNKTQRKSTTYIPDT